ncbi:hypothetical protein [Dyadobacter sandarakinus]|uniref:CcmD family protein n=1 Tax=Dyadobacter sandarakinus TaxID=2747268 RepID=A0ABX7I6Q4_9BACT|nr:hypothetical protein [Dyadobacter sandarakinus]QRR01574.1 hypothetical protein HWI92_11995 [Dyadobacter sandarakinus]
MSDADLTNPTTLLTYLIMLAISGLLGFLVRYSTESKRLTELKQRLVRINNELNKYAAREK